MNKLKIKIAIVFISFCQGLQFSISPVLNQIQAHYPTVNISLIQMLITAPAILAIIVAIISGWLVVKISKKKLLLLGSFITGITGFVPLLYDDFNVLLFSRILLGVGIGLVATLNTAVIADNFEGKERVSAMGLQGASVGTGMLLETTLGGFLGTYGYQYTSYVHIIGLFSTVMIFLFLPETGKKVTIHTEKIIVTKKVYKIAALCLIECVFLLSFNTNIAMHMSGNLAGNSSVSGMLIGVFSGVQIIVGLTLGYITRFCGKHTLPMAMLSFSVGSGILLFFPSSYVILLIGAIFCGISQGVFVPQAMYEASNAVKPVATAMAAAILTIAISMGQIISPSVLNNISKLIFGNITTSHVFAIAAVFMLLIPSTIILGKRREKN